MDPRIHDFASLAEIDRFSGLTNPRQLFGLKAVEPLLKRFAASGNYRSAAVEELSIQDDFCRRPLRPEDLDIIDFSRRLKPDDWTLLCGLASNRMLLCVNESARFDKSIRSPGFEDRPETREFYGVENRLIGCMIRPFLETTLFGELEKGGIEHFTDDLHELIDRAQDEIEERASALAEVAQNNDYCRKFRVLQDAGLAATKVHAIRRGRVDDRSSNSETVLPLEAVLEKISALAAERLRTYGLSTNEHTHWQFLLSTSLASANFIYRMAYDPLRWIELEGAAAHFVLESLVDNSLEGSFDREVLDEIRSAGLSAIEACARGDVYFRRRWMHGFALSQTVRRKRDNDLWSQLVWLKDIERYREIALAIDERIRRDRVAIDRETFVEPREMCSTTHVHNDHRLVVIEKGTMIFWAAPEMRLYLNKGEMTLVPRGRLHGSSVESIECIYHQPIIPEGWIAGSMSAFPWSGELPLNGGAE